MLNQENASEMIDFRDYNLRLNKSNLFKYKTILSIPPGLVGPNISLIFSIVGII